jgi:hypothetical protein
MKPHLLPLSIFALAGALVVHALLTAPRHAGSRFDFKVLNPLAVSRLDKKTGELAFFRWNGERMDKRPEGVLIPAVQQPRQPMTFTIVSEEEAEEALSKKPKEPSLEEAKEFFDYDKFLKEMERLKAHPSGE